MIKTFTVAGCLLALCIGAETSQAAGFRVARVQGSSPISLASYSHWSKVSTMSQAESYDKLVAGVVAIPPSYGRCVRTVHGRGASWARAWKLCQALFLDQNSNVMQLLITSSWIRGEAHERGLSVSRSKVLAEFKKTKKSAFPSEKDFKKFLRESGETVIDLIQRTSLDMLSLSIRKDVVKGLNSKQAADALSRFVPRFQAKWKSRTTCNHNFAIDLCGHRN